MWRQLVLAGTAAAVLFTGTAFAFASQAAPEAPASESGVELDHWSQMAIEMGDQWPAMVTHMEDTFGDRFPEMMKEMQLLEPETHGSGMGDFMDGSGMDGHMDGFGMGGFGTNG